MFSSALRFAVLPLAVAILIGPAAIAAPALEAPTRVVHYADLDLASPAGQVQLQRRLNRAATSVCPAADPMRLETVSIANKCRKEALAGVHARAQTAIATAQTRQRFAAADTAGRPSGL